MNETFVTSKVCRKDKKRNDNSMNENKSIRLKFTRYT